MTETEYQHLSKAKSPASHTALNCLRAFVIGGLICALGEALTQVANRWLFEDIGDARGFCSLCLIFLSVTLTGLGLYDRIARHAGAGTLVPITGFANAVAAPAIEFKTEGLLFGTAAKMFTIAGPVIVYGLTAAALYGVILWLLTLM